MSRPSAMRRWLRFLSLVWTPAPLRRRCDLVNERERIRAAARPHTLNHLKG